MFAASGTSKSGDLACRAQAIVKATTPFRDAKVIADVSRGLGEAMVGRGMEEPAEGKWLATHVW